MKPQPMITVHDVEASSRWYQRVLGCTGGHGGAEYEMLMDGDVLVMQLHAWDAHEHPNLGEEEEPSRGNGVMLWFQVDDFEQRVDEIRPSGAELIDGPLKNQLGPEMHQMEIWLRDPDGYTVVLSSDWRRTESGSS